MAWLSAHGAALLALISENYLTLAIDLVLTALTLQPLCNFLSYGWVRKFEEIKNSLEPGAAKQYLKIYWNQDVTEDKALSAFSDLYYKWYGRKRFAFPIVIVAAIALAANFVVAREISSLVEGGQTTTAGSAVAGAYTFVTWDFFSRVQRRILSTADIMRGALRLGIAIPLGFSFAALLGKEFGPFIAFTVGVFPLETISTILKRLANDKLKLELGANTAPDQVGRLSGIDRSIADRIEDADITTIPQLAWCDPIQLTMRSNLSFDYVADIVSQALAWVYLGDKLEILRLYGLRGAYEIASLNKDLSSDIPEHREMADKAQAAAAEAAQMPLDGLKYAFEQIAEDGATKFLRGAS